MDVFFHTINGKPLEVPLEVLSELTDYLNADSFLNERPILEPSFLFDQPTGGHLVHKNNKDSGYGLHMEYESVDTGPRQCGLMLYSNTARVINGDLYEV